MLSGGVTAFRVYSMMLVAEMLGYVIQFTYCVIRYLETRGAHTSASEIGGCFIEHFRLVQGSRRWSCPILLAQISVLGGFDSSYDIENRSSQSVVALESNSYTSELYLHELACCRHVRFGADGIHANSHVNWCIRSGRP